MSRDKDPFPGLGSHGPACHGCYRKRRKWGLCWRCRLTFGNRRHARRTMKAGGKKAKKRGIK